MKKMSLFKKSLLIYSAVALVLSVAFLIYIFFTLKDYERMQSGNFLENTVKSITDAELKEFLTENNLDESLLEDYKKLVNSKDVKFSKKEDNSFNVTLNDRVLFVIDTKVVKTGTKLGMFHYEEREATNITPNLERGLVYYDVVIPSNYELYVDGELVEGATTQDKYKGLDFMYHNESMPTLNTYEVNNLTAETKIEVKDFLGNVVNLNKNKYTYKVDNYILEAKSYDDAKKYIDGEVDIWEVAHTWSLFLTRDLGNNVPWGLEKVTPYLVPNTSLHQMARSWAYGQDIRFTSAHTLDDPTWTNERLENFEIYSKDAFSCEVYTEKHMTLKKNQQKRTDVMHDILYFVKVENEWKLINIKSVVEDKGENK